MDIKTYQIVEINSATEEYTGLFIDLKNPKMTPKKKRVQEIEQKLIYFRQSNRFSEFALFKGKMQNS